MANEVVIGEFKRPEVLVQGGVLPVYGELVTSQVLDIAEKSSAVSAGVSMVRVASKGTAFWFKVGDSDVSAAANTAGNIYVPADGHVDIQVRSGDYIDTAADA
jgi:hypothetical protein